MIKLSEISQEVFDSYLSIQRIIDYSEFSSKFYKIDIDGVEYVFSSMSDIVSPVVSFNSTNVLIGVDLHVCSISKRDKRINFLIGLHEFFLFFLDDYDFGFDIVTQRRIIEVEREELAIGTVRLIPNGDLIDTAKRADNKFIVTSIEGNIYNI